MRIGRIGRGWTSRSGAVRATFLAPMVACWLLPLLSRAGYRLHDAGPFLVAFALMGTAWAGFVAWRVAMNEHAAAMGGSSTGVGPRGQRR